MGSIDGIFCANGSSSSIHFGGRLCDSELLLFLHGLLPELAILRIISRLYCRMGDTSSSIRWLRSLAVSFIWLNEFCIVSCGGGPKRKRCTDRASSPGLSFFSFFPFFFLPSPNNNNNNNNNNQMKAFCSFLRSRRPCRLRPFGGGSFLCKNKSFRIMDKGGGGSSGIESVHQGLLVYGTRNALMSYLVFL